MKTAHPTRRNAQVAFGFTMIEILIVIAVLGILLLIAGVSAADWIERYQVESQTKEMFIDLMNTRVRALHKNRIFFVSLQEPARYIIYEDTHPSPDGDGDLQPELDKLVAQKMTRFPLIAHMGLGLTTFSFGANGLVSLNGTIQLDSSANAFSDCIKLFSTRILMGKWNGSSCVAQ